jgi:hypothetical protein
VERWRKPVIPAAVESDATATMEVGVHRTGVNWTLTEEDYQRVKEGRVCLKCMEPQEQPFPKVCSLPGCGYPIRAQQLIDLGEQFQGDKWIGSHINLDEELDRLDEKNYRDNYWVNEHHILIPKSVKK